MNRRQLVSISFMIVIFSVFLLVMYAKGAISVIGIAVLLIGLCATALITHKLYKHFWE